MPEKRHRLNDSEIPEVIMGLRLRLLQLLKERKDTERALVALRCYERLLEETHGRPKNYSLDWDYLSYVAENGEAHLLERLDKMKQKSKAST